MNPPGTVCCILCRGMIAYRNNDTTRFSNHMNYEHGAYFDMEFLLAACLMDEEERKAVRNVMELKYKSQKKESQEIKGSPSKRPISAIATDVTNKAAKVARTEKDVVVKKEVADEIRILPEDWDVPKTADDAADKKEEDQRIMFKCDGCEKSFLHRKSLQTHQVKFGHASNPEAPSPSEFSCKVANCKYTGNKSKDLQSHMTRMHKTATPTPPKSATPTPTKSATPPPSVAPSTTQSSELFTNMAKSWAKKKVTPNKTQNKPTKVKKEPVDDSKNNSLQEMSESLVNDESSSSETPVTDSSIADSSIDTSTEVSNGESKTIEDTTFVSIDSSSNDAENPDEVNISKSKYFKANPQTVSTMTEKAGAADQFTVVDDKLPAGWKVKEILHEFKSGRKERKRSYLTPDLKILKTGLAVLEYMRLSGRYSAKEIMDYAKYLSVPVNRLEKYMELYL